MIDHIFIQGFASDPPLLKIEGEPCDINGNVNLENTAYRFIDPFFALPEPVITVNYGRPSIACGWHCGG